MADINTGGGEQKKGKPKKMQLRVDFTPMVDMNMLLITFFMFCTTLSKPQMMDLVMPTKDDNLTKEQKTKTDERSTITLLLAEDDIVYYYFGFPNYTDYTSLVKSDYSPTGLRTMLAERNGRVVKKMAELRLKKQKKQITDEEFIKQSSEAKDLKDGLVVIIKPTDASTYKNLVDVLDEMQICSIGKYAIVDIEEGDFTLIENLLLQRNLSPNTKK
jgi:biopolymer transport protein ExbD